MRSRRTILSALAIASAALVTSPVHSASAATPVPAVLTGTGNGESPDVHVYEQNGAFISSFNAHASNTGARVASGDVDGDLKADYITATGPGAASQVTIRTQNGVQASFSPYGNFGGGVYVASGDVDGDTKAEIITAAGAGGGPHVIVWNFDNGQVTASMSFFAYDTGFTGGVRVAAGDLTGSTKADIITATGPGGGPHVKVFDVGSSSPVEFASFYAYSAGWTGGVNVAAGEIDGTRTIVTGVGPGGGPHVRLFSTRGELRKEFFAYAPTMGAGVNVALSTPTGGDLGHVLVAPASWAGPHVKATTSSGQTLFEFFAYAATSINGVNIAAIPQLGSSNSVNQSGAASS